MCANFLLMIVNYTKISSLKQIKENYKRTLTDFVSGVKTGCWVFTSKSAKWSLMVIYIMSVNMKWLILRMTRINLQQRTLNVTLVSCVA